jgi:hypothetical protein
MFCMPAANGISTQSSHPKAHKWLVQHPRWTFHFRQPQPHGLTPSKGFFAKLTNRRLKRGVFRSVAELQVAIDRFVDAILRVDRTSKPILAAVKCGKQTLESLHWVGACTGDEGESLLAAFGLVGRLSDPRAVQG